MGAKTELVNGKARPTFMWKEILSALRYSLGIQQTHYGFVLEMSLQANLQQD